MEKSGREEVGGQSQQPMVRSALSVKRPDKSLQNNSVQSMPNADSSMYMFYIDVTLPDVLLELPCVQVAIPNNYTVVQAVRRSLIALNQHLLSKDIDVSLEPSDYIPRLAKKTGKPKMDMPCLDDDQRLAQMKIRNVSLQIKKEGAVRLIQKQPDKQKTISTEIVIENKDKEIGEEEQPPKKKDGFCFFSFC